MATKWEYCKIINPIKVLADKTELGVGPAAVIRLRSSREDSEAQKIDSPDLTLAQMGEAGWELVSHTLLWHVVKAGITGPAPIMECFYLKRPIAEA